MTRVEYNRKLLNLAVLERNGLGKTGIAEALRIALRLAEPAEVASASH